MVIEDDAWQLILERDLRAPEIQEIAEQGLGLPKARWLYQDNGISLSDVRFYLELASRGLDLPRRIETWSARRQLYGLPKVETASLRRRAEPTHVM